MRIVVGQVDAETFVEAMHCGLGRREHTVRLRRPWPAPTGRRAAELFPYVVLAAAFPMKNQYSRRDPFRKRGLYYLLGLSGTRVSFVNRRRR